VEKMVIRTHGDAWGTSKESKGKSKISSK